MAGRAGGEGTAPARAEARVKIRLLPGLNLQRLLLSGPHGHTVQVWLLVLQTNTHGELGRLRPARKGNCLRSLQ